MISKSQVHNDTVYYFGLKDVSVDVPVVTLHSRGGDVIKVMAQATGSLPDGSLWVDFGTGVQAVDPQGMRFVRSGQSNLVFSSKVFDGLYSVDEHGVVSRKGKLSHEEIVEKTLVDYIEAFGSLQLKDRIFLNERFLKFRGYTVDVILSIDSVEKGPDGAVVYTGFEFSSSIHNSKKKALDLLEANHWDLQAVEDVPGTNVCVEKLTTGRSQELPRSYYDRSDILSRVSKDDLVMMKKRLIERKVNAKPQVKNQDIMKRLRPGV